MTVIINSPVQPSPVQSSPESRFYKHPFNASHWLDIITVLICNYLCAGEQNQLLMSEQILNYLTKTDNTYSENTYNATKDLYTVYIYWAIPCNITSSCSKGIQQNLNRFINVVNSNWVFYIINFSIFFYHSYVNCELCLWYQSSINTKYPWWNMYMT